MGRPAHATRDGPRRDGGLPGGRPDGDDSKGRASRCPTSTQADGPQQQIRGRKKESSNHRPGNLNPLALSNMHIGAPILVFFRPSAHCGSTCENSGWPRRDLIRLRQTSPYGESDMVKSITLQRIPACVLAAWLDVGRL